MFVDYYSTINRWTILFCPLNRFFKKIEPGSMSSVGQAFQPIVAYQMRQNVFQGVKLSETYKANNVGVNFTLLDSQPLRVWM